MKLAQKLAIKYIRAKLHILALVSEKKAAKKALELFSTPMRKANKKVPAIFETGEALSFKLEGHTVRGHRWKTDTEPGGETKRVLILHGFESASRNFDRYISAFLKKGYEVLAFDAPAHGESGGRYLNLPLYIATVQAICDQYGPVQSYLAHSFGGLAIAFHISNSPHDSQTKIALIAPVTETKTSIDLFFYFLQLDEGVRKEFDRLIFEKSGFRPSDLSIRRVMKNIKASVLWLHDENDDITPLMDALKVKDDNHPNLEFVVTKGLGHRKIYRDEGVMKRVVDFL